MILWALWSTRNALVWKHKVARVSSVLFLSTSVLDSWLRVQGNQDHSFAECLESKDGASVWLKPGTSTVKVNVDATIFSEAGAYSVAGIA